MRSKAKAIKVLIPICTISAIIYTVFLCNKKEEILSEWIKTICAGVFTSSLVSIFICFIEYVSEKRRVLESLYIELSDNNTAIRNLHFYSENELDELCNSTNSDIEEILEQYERTYKQIVFKSMDLLIGDISFVKSTNEKAVWKEIVFVAYEKESDYKKQLAELMRHINEFRNQNRHGNKGNRFVIIQKIKDIQRNFFISEKKEVGYCVYNEYAYRIELQLYYLLQHIYRNKYTGKTPEKKEFWAASYMINPFTQEVK